MKTQPDMFDPTDPTIYIKRSELDGLKAKSFCIGAVSVLAPIAIFITLLQLIK